MAAADNSAAMKIGAKYSVGTRRQSDPWVDFLLSSNNISESFLVMLHNLQELFLL
jgi:hypothetical protein